KWKPVFRKDHAQTTRWDHVPIRSDRNVIETRAPDSQMPINAEYRGPGDLPEVIPVFPLPGALLLPRGQMPLNIFEPRYLAMVDDALRDGHRLIGMIQPDVSHSPDETHPKL